ncbi:hypothetical protein CAOG_005270 [Capsaspora owczarzaki ATCC 30864]|uniref:SAM domain-containing protein n=1 Tax=Capsaspora owczarzaki (strain ATCC 30864) TaxID=595528 RepID=A0A0D2UHT9_CAPO3|nr:hypothetical protein CAOG_005270 [Capsaspora owczarzaki ATCC 30864]
MSSNNAGRSNSSSAGAASNHHRNIPRNLNDVLARLGMATLLPLMTAAGLDYATLLSCDGADLQQAGVPSSERGRLIVALEQLRRAIRGESVDGWMFSPPAGASSSASQLTGAAATAAAASVRAAQLERAAVARERAARPPTTFPTGETASVMSYSEAAVAAMSNAARTLNCTVDRLSELGLTVGDSGISMVMFGRPTRANPSVVPSHGMGIAYQLEATNLLTREISPATIVDFTATQVRVHFTSHPTSVLDYWCDTTSTLLHPIGYCKLNGLQLVVPNGGSWSWDSAVNTRQPRVHVSNFSNDQCAPPGWEYANPPENRFQVGMRLEAADVMPGSLLTCVATVATVRGAFVHITFDGWSDKYDYVMGAVQFECIAS